jgi:hypothetical protein
MTDLSPITGLTRDHWAASADNLLLSLRPWASPDHARIELPGRPSRYGPDSDTLEAFARTFLLAAIRLRGDDGRDPHGFAAWYAQGLRAGTTPGSPTAWPRPDVLGQAKVEACSIALGLHLSRPWLWDRLDATDQANIVAWLSTVIGAEYPPINWVWFQIVVETFLRSVGADWSQDDIDQGLAVHESLYRSGGWYADGPERSYDHYNGWALHVYPLLWADMAPDLCAPELRQAWAYRLTSFLDDAALLVGSDGSPLQQGRSLIYRYAAAAPFWVGAMTGASNLSPGQLRRAASGMLRHFTNHGVPNKQGLLSIGWYDEWPAMAQSYSGPGSPYWAVKGMFGLALPAEHPVWTAIEEPLPGEQVDTVEALEAPGWLVSTTAADGISRVINHGTDHSVPGDDRSDSPLYARLGYSTSTMPPLAGDSAERPRDNSAVLVHPERGATHRNGFETLRCAVEGSTAIGVSSGRAHWVEVEHDSPDHGSGRNGSVTWGPTITVASLIRGACEVRAVRVHQAAPDTHLELSGWPVDPSAGLTSTVIPVSGFDSTDVHQETGTSPQAERVAIPTACTKGAPVPGLIYVALVLLHGKEVQVDLPTVEVTDESIRVTWPDGSTASALLDLPDGSREA